MKEHSRVLVYVIAALLLVAGRGGAQEEEATADAETGSGKQKTQYAVVPGPFYSPSLGWGLMVIPMAMYPADRADTVSPPSMTAVFVLATENGSTVYGMGQKLYLDEDRWRITGGLGYGSVNQRFYGIGASDADNYIDMTMEARGFLLQGLRQLWTNVYGGMLVQYRQARFRGDNELMDRLLELAGLNYDYSRNIVPGIRFEYDSREDQFAPRSGMHVAVQVRGSTQDLGSTDAYLRSSLAYSQYATLWGDTDHVLAWNADVEAGSGDVPFDEYPDLGGSSALRGYVAGEFKDRNLVSMQAEYRWQAGRKFGLSGFAGIGKVFPAWDMIDDERWLPSGGFGFRYLVIPERRVNARLDLAWGRQGGTFYFSVGESF